MKDDAFYFPPIFPWKVMSEVFYVFICLMYLDFRRAISMPFKLNLKLAQHCKPTVCAQSVSHVQLCDPMDCIPPESYVHGVFQARILEWVVISYSKRSS